MSKEMKVAVYYSKPIVRLGDMNPGDYVFDNNANLCYIDEDYILHHYAIESWGSKDTIVYPITLETEIIMERMRKLRQKYHDSNLMNSYISHELEVALHEIMSLDIEEENYGKKEEDMWAKLERRYNEMAEHAKTLHIYVDPLEKLIWERDNLKMAEAEEVCEPTIWHSGLEKPDGNDSTLYLVVVNNKTTFDLPAYQCFWDNEFEKEPWGVVKTSSVNSNSCGVTNLRISMDDVEKWAKLDDLIGK